MCRKIAEKCIAGFVCVCVHGVTLPCLVTRWGIENVCMVELIKSLDWMERMCSSSLLYQLAFIWNPNSASTYCQRNCTRKMFHIQLFCVVFFRPNLLDSLAYCVWLTCTVLFFAKSWLIDVTRFKEWWGIENSKRHTKYRLQKKSTERYATMGNLS